MPGTPTVLPVVVLTGQLAAGKSTLALAVAGAFPRAVHIDVDAVRELVVSGAASPLEWTDETTVQFRLAVEGSMALAATYHRGGFVVVVEGAVDPADVVAAAAGTGLLEALVGVSLHPSLEVALGRNRARTHKGFDTSALEPVIRTIDADLRAASHPDGWHVLDNSAESVAATTARVLALVDRRGTAGPHGRPERA